MSEKGEFSELENVDVSSYILLSEGAGGLNMQLK